MVGIGVAVGTGGGELAGRGEAATTVAPVTLGAGEAVGKMTGVSLTSAMAVGPVPPGSCEARSRPPITVATTMMPAAIPPHSCRQSLLAGVCVVLNVQLPLPSTSLNGLEHKSERRAFAHFAIHPDAPTVRFYERLGN